MAEDQPEGIEMTTDSGRPRREPPTIDLEPNEVSGETRKASAGEEPKPSSEEPASGQRARPLLVPIIAAAVSGAGAAALVIALAWFLGWPGGGAEMAPLAAAPQSDAAIDQLASRLAAIEAKATSPVTAAPDPASASRIDSLEKSLAALRGDLSGLRAASDKLAAAVNDAKSAPRENSPSPDLSAINERIAGLERAVRDQSAATAQKDAKAADDVPLRRVVVASLLDVLVRTSDPYAAALAAAKSLSANPDALKPLDAFAAKGVPNAASLSRELLELVPKLSPPAPDSATTGSGVLGRLQAGAAKLVRIERTDAVGNDRGAVVTRATAAALRNDSNEARRELKTLEPADRAAAQAWLDKADARDAALASSRQFATEAMTALAQPAQ
jgi:hypothetical protein